MRVTNVGIGTQQGEMQMAKISLAGFKDPVRRPRYIIWTGVAVLVLAAVMIVALGVTSTRWFCAEGCHKVQDDTIIAYERSTHSNISCMACHMPANANPVVFILHKAEALGELYMTVTDNFELPLNGESEVALTMKSTQCTQCHNMENRVFTPSKGIKIEHTPHAEINAACPVCHNRIAHREDFDLTLTNPEKQGGEPNVKHADFMSMTACFRCHGLENGAAAPGDCPKCHTPGFNLKPPTHAEQGFLPKGHAEMAKEALAEVTKAEAESQAEGAEGEGSGAESTEGAEGSKETSLLGVEKAFASSGGEAAAPVSKEEVPEVIEAQEAHGEDPSVSIGEELPKVETIFECGTCHTEQFCINCHGMPMPHPAEFKEPKDVKDPAGHPAMSKDKAKAEKCVMCHGANEKTHFCDSCHHGEAIEYEYDKAAPWITQHPKAVAESGVKSCTEKCHSPKFCVDCHTGKRVVPASHRPRTWTRPKTPTVTVYGEKPAAPSATHALEAQKSMESCEVCHGPGGTEAKFCKSCHGLALPHADEFKKNHVSSKNSPRRCVQCHTWPELCSNCHHIGSSRVVSWTRVHGRSVNKFGSTDCLKCHGGDSGTDKSFCVKCHQSRRVVPASHRAKKFVRDYSATMAVHVQQFDKSAETCTYCHTGDPAKLPTSKFCNSCHRLTMPHPDGFGAAGKGNGGEHQKLFEEKKTRRAVCTNCHTPTFCNSCHHEGAPANRPWVRYHPNVVKKDGADACFDCHQETYCSNCHVNLAKRGLL